MGDRNYMVGGVGIIAFVVLCVVAIWQELPDIERGIVERSAAALDEASINYVSVEAEGRIAKIVLPRSEATSGDAVDEAIDVGYFADIFRAELSFSSSPAVSSSRQGPTTTRRTTTTPAPAIEPVSPPELQIDVIAGVVTALEGRVGSPGDTSALAERIGPPSGWNLTEDAATIALPPDVLDIIESATADLAEGHISYTDGDLLITGVSTGAEASDRFDRLAQLADDGFTATYDVTEPLGSIESAIDDALGPEGIGFSSGTATISQAGQEVLDEVATILVSDRGLRIRIEGHTDSVGSAAANLQLSADRAAAVAVYLSEAGVEPLSITTEGLGDTQPIGDNATEEGKAANRRIEFSVSREGGASS